MSPLALLSLTKCSNGGCLKASRMPCWTATPLRKSPGNFNGYQRTQRTWCRVWGGNDALGYLPQLGAPAANVIGALVTLFAMLAKFRHSYTTLMAELLALNKPLIVCTVYDALPGLTDPLKAALGMFNDVIVREAIRDGVPVLNLRMICTEPGDDSAKSPIEPSSQGGAKLADRLVAAMLAHDFTQRGCRIYL